MNESSTFVPLDETITRLLPSPADTDHFGAAFAQAWRTQPTACVVHLHGELGAGKTAFVRAVLRTLGVTGPIKSPTYAIAERYPLPGEFEAHHMDFYRLEHPLAWEEAGLAEAFHPRSLIFIEWPQHAQGLPQSDLAVALTTTQPDGRVFATTAHTDAGRAIVQRWFPR